MRTRAHLLALVAALVLGATLLATSGVGGIGFSGATFTARTTSTATVSAAADWTPPTVTLANPGSPVKDTVALTASASDAETGIKDVSIQYFAASGWTTICTTTASPYTCAWNTKALADGAYDLRAVASDNAGYATVSATVRTTVANSLLVVLGDPGDFVRGTQSLSTTLYNTGTTTYTVRVEYAPAGTTIWKSICSGLAAPYTCTWDTIAFANGDYDLRSVAVAGPSSTPSAVVRDVMVDNLAPSVTMTDPGTPLSGTRTFAATATDAHSGVAQVTIQWAPTGSTSWQSLCSITIDPYSCSVDTTRLADGAYSFRAVATDAAGNSTVSAAVANRVVDNTVSSVGMDDPGAFLSGTVTLSATANSSAGVTSVRIQRAPSGTTTWTDVCTMSTSPYRCSWDTTKLADGLYDFRAVLLDGAGRTTTSTVVSARRVDNTLLRGYDVQTVNGGASPGKLENGDTLTLTYTEQVNPATLSAGWNGGAIAVTLRIRDGGVLGLTGKNDTVDVLRSGASVNLGSVNLKEDYVKGGKTATFNATMSAGTTTVNGVTATVVTVRLGTLASGGGLRTANTASTMVWTPSAAAADPNGLACSAAPTSELGALDREW